MKTYGLVVRCKTADKADQLKTWLDKLDENVFEAPFLLPFEKISEYLQIYNKFILNARSMLLVLPRESGGSHQISIRKAEKIQLEFEESFKTLHDYMLVAMAEFKDSQINADALATKYRQELEAELAKRSS
jgi:hypothetical protein